jgi:hypothetical protein
VLKDFKMPVIQGEYSSNFKRINFADIYGHINSGGLEASIYSEQSVIDEVITTQPISREKLKIKRIVECDLFIDPMKMVSVYEWLGKKIEEYEKIFGKIPTPKEIEKKIDMNWAQTEEGLSYAQPKEELSNEPLREELSNILISIADLANNDIEKDVFDNAIILRANRPPDEVNNYLHELQSLGLIKELTPRPTGIDFRLFRITREGINKLKNQDLK